MYVVTLDYQNHQYLLGPSNMWVHKNDRGALIFNAEDVCTAVLQMRELRKNQGGGRVDYREGFDIHKLKLGKNKVS